jgi:hypothetical protein
VLLGQARRSGEARSPYRCAAEFAAAVDLLLDEPGLAEGLGASVPAVAANYRWDVVIDRYEALQVAMARAHGRKRLTAVRRDRTAAAQIGSRGRPLTDRLKEMTRTADFG